MLKRIAGNTRKANFELVILLRADKVLYSRLKHTSVVSVHASTALLRDLPVKPAFIRSQEGTYVQLRPGESFFVRYLCFILVSEKVNDAYALATATVPSASSYERYSFNVARSQN